MLQTIEGIYHNGQIKLLETPKQIRRARVIVTFLDAEGTASNDNQDITNLGEIVSNESARNQQNMVGTIEILDDLEAASIEIREEFLAAIEKSCADFDK